MRNTIIKIAVRAVIAVVMTCTLLYVLGAVFKPKYITENVDGNVTAEFYNVKTPIDAAFFGSSTVYNAIPADYLWHEYGIASYTRANASQTMWQSYYLIKDTLKSQKPQLITLDVSFMKYGEDFFEEPSNRKTIDGMRLSADKLRCAKVSMWEEEDLMSYIFPILRFHSRWNELKKEDLLYAFKRPSVTYDGFVMEFNEDEDDTAYEPPLDEDRDFPYKAKVYLASIIELCEKEDIELLLMKTPTYTSNWYPAYDRRLMLIASQYKNCEYVNFDNFEEVMGIDMHRDYVDGHSHLNVKGAEKFSAVFGAFIRDQYGLPDHKNDETYSRYWDKQYERYEEAKREGIQKSSKKELSAALQ